MHKPKSLEKSNGIKKHPNNELQKERKWIQSLVAADVREDIKDSREMMKQMIKKGGTIAFWAEMFRCSENSVQRRIKRAKADKEHGATYIGTEMRRICSGLFTKLEKEIGLTTKR